MTSTYFDSPELFGDPESALSAVGSKDLGATAPVGVFRRFKTDDHPNKKNGWITGLVNTNGGFVCGNWFNGKLAIYIPGYKQHLSKEQLKQIREQARQSYLSAQRVIMKERRFALDTLARLINNVCYNTLSIPHPYLYRKMVTPFKGTVFEFEFGVIAGSSEFAIIGNLLDPLKAKAGYFTLRNEPFPEGFNRVLLVPVYDIDGYLQTAEFITYDGEKRFMPCCTTKGGFWSPYDNPKPKAIGICEGMATALSVAEDQIEDKNNWLIIAAMTCGNLEPVAISLNRKYPGIPITFFADSDKPQEGKDKGIGEIKAREATKRIYGIEAGIQLPEFSEADTRLFRDIFNKDPTDFNDLRILNAIKAEFAFRMAQENLNTEGYHA
ncbi:MAG: hypothetical protein LUC47_09790 [Clostridiales bacterium]|nr:hypothetical protein [Clostridiales bacterium]